MAFNALRKAFGQKSVDKASPELMRDQVPAVDAEETGDGADRQTPWTAASLDEPAAAAEVAPDDPATMVLKNKTKSNQSNDRLGQEDGSTVSEGDGDAPEAVVQYQESDLELRDAGGEVGAGAGDGGGEGLRKDITINLREAEGGGLDAAGVGGGGGGGAIGEPAMAANLNLSKSNINRSEGEPPADEGPGDPAMVTNLNSSRSNIYRTGDEGLAGDGAGGEGSMGDGEAAAAQDARYHEWRWNSREGEPAAGGEPGGVEMTSGDPVAEKGLATGISPGTTNLARGSEDDGVAVAASPDPDTGMATGKAVGEKDHGQQLAADDGGAQATAAGEQKKWLTSNFRQEDPDDDGPSTLLDLSGDADAGGVIAVADLDLDGLPDTADLDLEPDADPDGISESLEL